MIDGKLHKFCRKCNRGKGRWVSGDNAHLTADHVDGFMKKKREQQLLNKTYDPVATIIADQSTPYRLITEVMYTAGQAELSKFKFAVIKKNRSDIGPAN